MTRVRPHRPQAHRAFHLHVGRRQDAAARPPAVPVQLRSREEVSDAGQRLWRAGLQRRIGNLLVREPAGRVRLSRSCAWMREPPAERAARFSTRSTSSSAWWRWTILPPAYARCGSRPYVDAYRVGIYGTSYGGTVAATVLLRHPDAVQAAVSNSPVTDYRLYDTAYSERYLGLPETDKDAYDRAAVLTYADRLAGRSPALLRHVGRQCAPEELAAVHPGAAGGGQELRGAGRTRPRSHRASTRPA